MRLHEYQSKSLFARYGIPIPKGRIASSATEAKQISEELGGNVVIKSQVLVGGRGKAGGIRLAKSNKEAEEYATEILGMIRTDSIVTLLITNEDNDRFDSFRHTNFLCREESCQLIGFGSLPTTTTLNY